MSAQKAEDQFTLKAVRYRVQNFRNIDDSGWVPLERVTAFVGRNESGKTNPGQRHLSPALLGGFEERAERSAHPHRECHVQACGPHGAGDHRPRPGAGAAGSRTEPATDRGNDRARPAAKGGSRHQAEFRLAGYYKRFNDWYQQRRHTIDYQADGGYFRIWVADDRRPGVRIELEGRSKGFQWFFSFYLVFLVESDEGHKDAVLLLDEPGLHLHPTAQQGLIDFFDKLAEKNQLIYTTHSPFLIDGEHLHRVRPVTEDKSGHSRINAETWPSDRETIFPLQAAAGYAMVRGLFQHKKNMPVEGMSDYYYLHALGQQSRATKRAALPGDIYITPCGGTKLVGHIASLFLGQEIRPLVLLDGDEAGRARRDALIKELYVDHLPAVLMLDEALGQSGSELEVEDILGEAMVLRRSRRCSTGNWH